MTVSKGFRPRAAKQSSSRSGRPRADKLEDLSASNYVAETSVLVSRSAAVASCKLASVIGCVVPDGMRTKMVTGADPG